MLTDDGSETLMESNIRMEGCTRCQYYRDHIEAFSDVQTRLFVEQVLEDRTYIPCKHTTQPWQMLIPRLCTLIRRIVIDHFRADLQFVDFYSSGSGMMSLKVDDLISRIESKLQTKFATLPPFTIYPFIETMLFLADTDVDNCIDKKLIDQNVKIQYDGLKKYKRKVIDLINDEHSEVDVINRYHNPETASHEIPMNNVYATKYLRSLLKIISVESTITDVACDLQGYGSKNSLVATENRADASMLVDNEEEESDDTASVDTGRFDTSSNSIKMIKIPWYDPTIHTTDKENDGNDTDKDIDVDADGDINITN